MAELATTVSELLKGKRVSENLPVYVNGLKSLYKRMAYIRLALNYYTFSEIYFELNKDRKSVCSDEVEAIQQLVKDIILEDKLDDLYESTITKLRAGIISKMEGITAYTDKLQIYEYILNRVEFRFNDCEYDTKYYKNEFEKDIYNFVTGDRDNSAINMRLSMVMGELPMRLSRNKFFDVLKDSFSIYKGSEKQSVDDFAYRIRTAGAIYETKKSDKKLSRLNKALEEFKGVDYQNITKEQYEVMRNKMDAVTELAMNYSDIFVVITEIINDIYTILLCDNALYDAGEREGLVNIIEYCYGVIEGENEPDVTVAEKFVEYEGLQEKIGFMIDSPEAALMEILDANRNVIEQLGSMNDMLGLDKVSKLQSSSTFVTFDEDASKKEEADDKYIAATVEELVSSFSEVFTNNDRLYNRAVMGTVVSNLPAYFNNLKEFEEYVHVALGQCNDEAEQRACMTLINMLIASE